MSSTVEDAYKKVVQLQAEVGRSTLNMMYPSDFEVYLMSFELVKINENGKEEVLNFFSFPVMPNNISQSEPQITNIKKTVGGITILNTNTFIPKDVTIQGNFGRSFKLLISNESVNFRALALNPKQAIKSVGQAFKKKVSEILDAQPTTFSNTVKTGYGCIKILQAICDASVDIDNGRPRRLYFHNPAFGESHLVKITSFTANQNMQQNMIWGYNLQMKLISPIENVRVNNDNSLKTLLTISSVQNGINKIGGYASRMLNL